MKKVTWHSKTPDLWEVFGNRRKKVFKTLFEGRGSNTNHFKLVFMGFDLLFYTCSFNVLVYIEITAQFRSQIRSHMQLKVAAEGGHPNR